MQIIEVAETKVITDGLIRVLKHLGAPNWESNTIIDADYLAEFMGRLCYKSFEAGLNPNVTKVREGNKPYLANLLGQRHGSVFEHASVSFVMLNVSRILTHELVRHRVGISYSQESQRFVRLDNFDCYVPDLDDPLQALAGILYPDASKEDHKKWSDDKALWYVNAVEQIKTSVQDKLASIIIGFQLDDPKVPFHIKKEITSALRRMVPGGVNTNIGVSANHRTWRYLMETRTAPGAEIEIRQAFVEVGKILTRDYPGTYQDAKHHMVDNKPNDPGYWTFANSKI